MNIRLSNHRVVIGECKLKVGDPVHIIVCNPIGLNMCYDVTGVVESWDGYKLYLNNDRSVEYFMIRDIVKTDEPCISIHGYLFKVGDDVEVTYKCANGYNHRASGCLFNIDTNSDVKTITVGVFNIKVGHIISISKGGVTHETLSFRV